MGAYIAFPVGFYWLYVSLLPGIFPHLWPMWIGVVMVLLICIRMVRDNIIANKPIQERYERRRLMRFEQTLKAILGQNGLGEPMVAVDLSKAREILEKYEGKRGKVTWVHESPGVVLAVFMTQTGSAFDKALHLKYDGKDLLVEKADLINNQTGVTSILAAPWDNDPLVFDDYKGIRRALGLQEQKPERHFRVRDFNPEPPHVTSHVPCTKANAATFKLMQSRQPEASKPHLIVVV